MIDDGILDMWISKTEDELTARAKQEQQNKNHSDKSNVKPTMVEKGRGIGQTVATSARQLFRQVAKDRTRSIRFAGKPSVQIFSNNNEAVMVPYDSGLDWNYMSEDDRSNLGLPIPRKSNIRVGVANWGASK